MAAAASTLDRSALYALPRRHPWLAASVGAHLLLAASLYRAGPVHVERQRTQGVQARVERSLAATDKRQMRRELRAMEEIRDALEQSTGMAPRPRARRGGADDPEQQARELARAIEKVEQQVRAAELARLLEIPEAQARKRVQQEAARRPKPVPPKGLPPQAVVAQLARQARDALARRRVQLAQQRQGIAVNQPGTGLGDGRMSGVAGGRGSGGVQSGQPSASVGGRLDALAKGLGMEPPGTLMGSSLDMSSTAFSDQRSYAGYLAPPPVDAGRVRAGGGRTIGAGGAYANRIHLDTWYVIGPFEGQGGASRDAVYPPERGVDLDAVYYGKNDLPVRWTWQQDPSYPTIPRPRAEHAVYYAWTEVNVEEDVDLWVSIGADDDSKMWFNDRLVWISADGDKPWYRQAFTAMDAEIGARNLAEGQRKLHFTKGRNTILFKLYNGVDLMFFSVVLAPAEGT
ncbi:hypothetical protein [uncultured Massilia sp.]|uniref:hypothetical protein n=1 Tax=uncultured Massilia sp. TaxID=169973 RepID=UPI0025FC5ACD|nr:hypothetical protein [uncultured Massilia sp.]